MKLNLKEQAATVGKRVKDSRLGAFLKNAFKKREEKFDLDPATAVAIMFLIIILGAKAASGGFNKKKC